jgi:hypothetical protein
MEKHILEEHAFECAFCMLKFTGFEMLSDHVKRAHTGELDGEVEYIRYKYEGEIDSDDPFNEEKRQGRKDMLQKRSGTTRGAFAGKRTDWLQDSHLTIEQQKVKIVDAQEGQSGNSVIVKLDIAGTVVFDTWRNTNPNFDLAVDALGSEVKKWKGKVCTMFLEYDEFADRNWRRVSFGK